MAKFTQIRQGFGVCLVLVLVTVAAAQIPTISLEVDATDATRKIIHSRLTIPVRPGTLRLFYPQWIPGEHGPTGPLNDLVDLQISAAGKTLSWKRDPEQMYAIEVDVPDGVDQIEVAFNYLLAGEGSTKLLHLSWNRVLLYPAGFAAADLKYSPSLRLPAGWKLGTALPVEKESESATRFATVSLETLVDSPVAAAPSTCCTSSARAPSQSTSARSTSRTCPNSARRPTRCSAHTITENTISCWCSATTSASAGWSITNPAPTA
jgi:predicted metalloprotease with PDZ domain